METTERKQEVQSPSAPGKQSAKAPKVPIPKKKKKWLKRIVTLVIVVAVIVLVLRACSGGTDLTSTAAYLPSTAQMQDLVAKNGLGSRVDLNGAFCSGNCVKEGVCVTVDGELFSVKPEETKDFFEREILGRI